MHVTILGCGQLARLMAIAGRSMGIQFSFVAIDKEETSAIEGLGNIIHWSNKEPVNTLLKDLKQTNVVTVERESIDINLLTELSNHVTVHPEPNIIASCQNRFKEKLAVENLEVPATPWLSVTTAQAMEEAVQRFNYPLVVKSVEQGYDGRNQWRITNPEQLDWLINNIQPIDWIVEPLINFNREASLIGVRSAKGEVRLYAPAENLHVQGVLRTSVAPAELIPESWLKMAQSSVVTLMERWNYVGVLAMELFITPSGPLINELAPRVHNSGHWTDAGSQTSQFENHLRAILDLPLGSTENTGFAAMINILGNQNSRVRTDFPDTNVHFYNKSARPGRKLGHINLVESHRDKLLSRMKTIETLMYSDNLVKHRA